MATAHAVVLRMLRILRVLLVLRTLRVLLVLLVLLVLRRTGGGGTKVDLRRHAHLHLLRHHLRRQPAGLRSVHGEYASGHMHGGLLLVGEAPSRHGTSHELHAAVGEVAALHLLLLPHGDRLRLQRARGASWKGGWKEEGTHMRICILYTCT